MREQSAALDNVSLASSIFSDPILFDNSTIMSIMAMITGSPNGELKLQVSNDLTDIPGQVSNWMDYTGSQIAVSGASSESYELVNFPYKWLRIVYTRASGSGNITANRYSILGV